MFAFRKREKLSLLDNCLKHTIDVINYSVFGDFDRTAKTMADEWWRSSEKWKASKVYRQMPMPSFKSFQEAQKNVNAIWNSKKKIQKILVFDTPWQINCPPSYCLVDSLHADNVTESTRLGGWKKWSNKRMRDNNENVNYIFVDALMLFKLLNIKNCIADVHQFILSFITWFESNKSISVYQLFCEIHSQINSIVCRKSQAFCDKI